MPTKSEEGMKIVSSTLARKELGKMRERVKDKQEARVAKEGLRGIWHG